MCDTNKKTAVVIGATGYVGSAVTKALGEHGVAITCTSRDVDKALWLKGLTSGKDQDDRDHQDNVAVVSLRLSNNAGEETTTRLRTILRGSDMAFLCAGFEEQSPSTIDFMVSNAVALIEAAKAERVPVVVLTSSGGSTNPPLSGTTPAAGTIATPKSEVLHFSDPDEQIGRGRYSPAAKTLMELKAFEAVGRNHKNEIVDRQLAEDPSTPRLVIVNPNLILGPQLDPCPTIKGNSLPWMLRILKKETMADFVPNDSMSIIDIQDLAELHVAAALDPKASGRYFGVNRSYAWKEILGAFASVLQEKKERASEEDVESSRAGFSYVPPPLRPGEDYDSNIPTQFDHARKNSLGVTLRPLRDTLRDLVDFFQTKGAI